MPTEKRFLSALSTERAIRFEQPVIFFHVASQMEGVNPPFSIVWSCQQGDQMSLRKNRPKPSPNHILSKY
jgi:hypothetical protein